MEEIIEKWYEISLIDMIKIINDNKVSRDCLKHIPLTNFTIDYIYSSKNGITPVVSSVTEIFSIKGEKCAENNLEYYVKVFNAHNYPNAKLRFRFNMLKEHNDKIIHGPLSN